LQIRGEQTAVRHEHEVQRAPATSVGSVDGTDRDGVFRRHHDALRERAVVVVALQAQAAFTARAPALQRDVGCSRVVACAHGRIADDPVALLQARRVGADVA